MRSKPWSQDELTALATAVAMGQNPAEAAWSVRSVRGINRTANACYFYATRLGLLPDRHEWNQERKRADYNEGPADPQPNQASDRRFEEAMAREGRERTGAVTKPGTAAPRSLDRPTRSSGTSSPSGWGV